MTPRRFYDDDEVLELLRDEPELIGIVDAIAQTQSLPAHGRARPLRRKRPLLLAAALAVVGILALVVAPWRGKDIGIVDRAAAAVSGGPVVHARVERATTDESVVELASGLETPTRIEIETWFDEASRELRTRTVRNGVAVSDLIEHTGSDQPPVAPDPAVALFASGYRSALETGRARIIAEEESDTGARLQVRVAPNASQVVTLNGETNVPVSFTAGSGPAAITWKVREMDARTRAHNDFEPQQLPAGARSGAVVRSRRLGPAAFDRNRAPWPGTRFGTFRLERVLLERLVQVRLDRRRSISRGFRLLYRSEGGATLQIQLSERAEPAYGYAEGRRTLSFSPIPDEGKMALFRGAGPRPAWIGQLRREGWHVTIRSFNKGSLLAAARQLRSTPG